jgi:hypothetical protein
MTINPDDVIPHLSAEEIRQLGVFQQLPIELRNWWEGEVVLKHMQMGREPDHLYEWFSFTVAERWRLIAYLIIESRSPRPLPRINLARQAIKSANPLPELNKSANPDTSNVSKLFDLTDLIKEDKRSLYPHAAFFCPPGWGKDFNSSKLLGKSDGEIIACLIKEPEIWRSHCPQARVVCNGYDVSAIEKVLQEVNDRNESRMLNFEPKTPLTVVFSDYPSIVQGIEDITDKYISRPIRDGRSNKIRFWFLTQESNVEALDLKGRSDLLKCVTMIRGGEFGLEHALSLIKTGLLTKQDIQFLNNCDRPCIVGNTPASVN